MVDDVVAGRSQMLLQIVAELEPGVVGSDVNTHISIVGIDAAQLDRDEVRFALAIAEPASTGVKYWDAALAGLVDHRLREEGLSVPSWTDDPARILRKSWTFNAGRYVVPVARDRVPQAFLDRNVLIDRETLESY